MALSVVTAATVEPVSIQDAKDHCRITTSDEDSLVAGYVVSAREYCEHVTHRTFLSTTFDLKVNGFPCADAAIWLPGPPLISVTSITYVDTNGTSQTWSSALYTVDAPAGPYARAGCIVPIYGESYPQTRDQINAVTIRFVAGYGTTASAVPRQLKSAIQIRVMDLYMAGRQSVAIGNSAGIVSTIPGTLDALLWPYKAF
jgi:uncharacterized phiE125 gp8 family phage protein